MNISVIFSFLNEENNIPELLHRTRNMFKALLVNEVIVSYELIFVNDCSTDKSEEILRNELSKGDVILINMTRHGFGGTECVLAGMSISTGDAVIYMDSDLQDPPELIPEMIKKWKNDPEVEVVYTTRTRRHGEHWLKLMLTKFGYRIINKMSDIEIYVDSGDFKLLSRKVVNHILSLNENTPYLRGLISWVGYKQVQVMYEREPRYDGRENTKNRMYSLKVIRNFLDRALISYTDAPLKLTLLFGFLISFISFLFIIFIFIQKFIGNSIPGWSAIMSGIFLFGGIQITILGFIGLYVGSIFRAVKNRPLYLIKEVIRK